MIVLAKASSNLLDRTGLAEQSRVWLDQSDLTRRSKPTISPRCPRLVVTCNWELARARGASEYSHGCAVASMRSYETVSNRYWRERSSWGIYIVWSRNIATASEDKLGSLNVRYSENLSTWISDSAILVVTIYKRSINLVTNPTPVSGDWHMIICTIAVTNEDLGIRLNRIYQTCSAITS
jgi:hypothetical protein